MDGEQRTWHVLEHRSEEGTESSSTMGAMPGFGGESYILDVQAHSEERFSVEGALHFSGMLDSLEGCPCELTLTDSMYWTALDPLQASPVGPLPWRFAAQATSVRQRVLQKESREVLFA